MLDDLQVTETEMDEIVTELRTYSTMQMVDEFIERMGQQDITVELAERIFQEEVVELVEAAHEFSQDPNPDTAEAVVKESADMAYTMAQLASALRRAVERGEDPMLSYQTSYLADMGDSVDQALSIVISQEVQFEAVCRVHDSNMSKLDDEGNPIRNEHGKIMKGPNYKAPDLEDLAAEVLISLFEKL